MMMSSQFAARLNVSGKRDDFLIRRQAAEP